MRSMPIAAILAVIALVLAVFAILDVVRAGTALGLAVICLALAVLLPTAAGYSRDKI